MQEYIDKTLDKTDMNKITEIEAQIESIFKKYFYDKYLFNAVKVLKESKAPVSIKQKYAFFFWVFYRYFVNYFYFMHFNRKSFPY